MGTWGSGLFDDDTALEVRDEYLALLAAGSTVADATQAVLQARELELADTDEAPIVWLALASTQWEYGAFGPSVLETALTVLEKGDSLQRWEEDGRCAPQRRRVLDQLAAKLRRPLPRTRRPRHRKPALPPPARSVSAPHGLAKVTVYQLSADPKARERSQVICEMESNGSRGGGHVAVLRCPWDAVGLTWVTSDTVRITHPSGALGVLPEPTVHNPLDWVNSRFTGAFG